MARKRIYTDEQRELNQRRHSNTYLRSIEGRFSTAKAVAKRRGLSWELGFDDYQRLIENNQCHYCQKKLNESGVGLDRKENVFSYEIGNVVPCCYTCNTIKGQWLSYREMVFVMRSLLLFRRDVASVLKKAHELEQGRAAGTVAGVTTSDNKSYDSLCN